MREPTEREVLEVMDALLGFYSKELKRSDDPADKLTLRQVRLEAEKACRAFLAVSTSTPLEEWSQKVRLTIRGIDAQAERLTRRERTTFRDGENQEPSDEDYEDTIIGYKLNTGLWHRLLGLLATFPIAPQSETGRGEGAKEDIAGSIKHLRMFVERESFWNQQPYGTRFYYGDGGLDYIQRGLLESIVEAYAAHGGTSDVPSSSEQRDMDTADAGDAAALYAKLYHEERAKREQLERELRLLPAPVAAALDRIAELERELAAAIERERLATMRADQAEEARDAAQSARAAIIEECAKVADESDPLGITPIRIRRLASSSATVERNSK